MAHVRQLKLAITLAWSFHQNAWKAEEYHIRHAKYIKPLRTYIHKVEHEFKVCFARTSTDVVELYIHRHEDFREDPYSSEVRVREYNLADLRGEIMEVVSNLNF